MAVDYDHPDTTDAARQLVNASGLIDQPRQRATAAGKATRERRRPKAYHPPEREVQKSGIAILKAMGWRVYRRNVGGMTDKAGQFIRFGEPGMSDTWGITPDGRHFELEFKRYGERPSEVQLAWLKDMNDNKSNGPVSFWADSTEVVQKVAQLIDQGCTVEYRDDRGAYRLWLPKRGIMLHVAE